MAGQECGWRRSTGARRHDEFRRQTATILDLVVTERFYFELLERSTSVLYRILLNGERRERIAQVHGAVLGTVSPDGEWVSSIGYEQLGK